MLFWDLGPRVPWISPQQCQLMESQRYMFINSTFNVVFVLRINEVLCLVDPL